jgi:hypothetical protein
MAEQVEAPRPQGSSRFNNRKNSSHKAAFVEVKIAKGVSLRDRCGLRTFQRSSSSGALAAVIPELERKENKIQDANR